MATYSVKLALNNGATKFVRVEAPNKSEAEYRGAMKAENLATSADELVSHVIRVGRG